MSELSKATVSRLKSNTYSTVYKNTLAELPIVVAGEDEFIEKVEATPIVDAINKETGERYTGGIDTIKKSTIASFEREPEQIQYLRSVDIDWTIRRYNIQNVRKFHYNDIWYAYKASVDNPEETFGILKVENLPFRKLDKVRSRKSFVCRMDQLIFTDLIQPFILFINYEFVNWNLIDVVFDGNESYLLVHGEKYNYYNLRRSDTIFHIVILPSKTEFVGVEPDFIWNKNYEMLKAYMQESLYSKQVDGEERIFIEVPNMYSIYTNRGMIYNVGAWLFTQVYMNHLGLLSEDRAKAMKSIQLIKYTYDASGNVVDEYRTRFNGLDKDSYDRETYFKICHTTLDYLKERALFRFDNDGKLDLENGENIVANLDDRLEVVVSHSSDTNIALNNSDHYETLYRESFLVFKNRLFHPNCKIDFYGANVTYTKNKDNEPHTFFIFYPPNVENTIEHHDNFIRNKLASQLVSYLRGEFEETEDGMLIIPNAGEIDKDDWEEFIKLQKSALDYDYSEKALYDYNYKCGLDEIIKYNPLLLKDLTKTTIKSTYVSGKKANESITFPDKDNNDPYSNNIEEYRAGLKIPRQKYEDHETFVIIFVNGELIENYSDMYVTSNYFYLPVPDNVVDNKWFNDSDNIELLFFTYCDNNEIHFDTTNLGKPETDIAAKLIDSEDEQFLYSSLFEEYISATDIKIFAEYPEEIMIYKDLIDKRKDIAFNVSYRDSSGKLMVFKDVMLNKNYKFTAVSSRKFIYERLYVDQRSFRIALSERFRYCDNQRQYMLFINGRRMEDDTFLITIPKYTRPFNGMYLYTAKFVTENDRVELFYVPEDIYAVNNDRIYDEHTNINSSGFIEAVNKKLLEVPYSKDFYLYFLNGKKIPYNHIADVDSHTVKLKYTPNTMKRLNVYPAYTYTHDVITEYMKSNEVSEYDYLVSILKRQPFNGVETWLELSKLIWGNLHIVDFEPDMIKPNVDYIALINEIVRDFWVKSGYQYNELPPFVYDYALDEFIVKGDDSAKDDHKEPYYILPSLDASHMPYINIDKNNIVLKFIKLFLINDDGSETESNGVLEIGSTLDNLIIRWQFYNHDGQGNTTDHEDDNCSEDKEHINLVSQYVNGVMINVDDREYHDNMVHTDDFNYHFHFNTLQGLIEATIKLNFCNGLYWGVIDEDKLQYFDTNGLVAITPIDDNKNPIPLDKLKDEMPTDEQLIHLPTMSEVMDKYRVTEVSYAPIDEDNNLGSGNFDDTKVITINKLQSGDDKGYYTPSDLQRLMEDYRDNMTVVYQDSVTINHSSLDGENGYVIGNNNYFIFTCPKRLAYDYDDTCKINFFMPGLRDADYEEHWITESDYQGDNPTTVPIYTDGNFDDLNSLIRLEKMYMVFMGEYQYTNKSGYTETYVMWRTNGFFTKNMEDYKFNIKIISTEDLNGGSQLQTVFTKDNPYQNENDYITKISNAIRIVNTASPKGSTVNDGITLAKLLEIEEEQNKE